MLVRVRIATLAYPQFSISPTSLRADIIYKEKVTLKALSQEILLFIFIVLYLLSSMIHDIMKGTKVLTLGAGR